MAEQHRSDAERIYQAWHEAFSRNDMASIVALYAPDATLESPSIRHLMGKDEGICRGRDEIRSLFEVVARGKPRVDLYRKGFFTDGHILVWEYPRERPDGEQMEFVEVMELDGGFIRRHRVYWGWFSMERLAHAQMPDCTPEDALAALVTPRRLRKAP
jgi:ketosteroid isomerase-like protein